MAMDICITNQKVDLLMQINYPHIKDVHIIC